MGPIEKTSHQQFGIFPHTLSRINKILGGRKVNSVNSKHSTHADKVNKISNLSNFLQSIKSHLPSFSKMKKVEVEETRSGKKKTLKLPYNVGSILNSSNIQNTLLGKFLDLPNAFEALSSVASKQDDDEPLNQIYCLLSMHKLRELRATNQNKKSIKIWATIRRDFFAQEAPLSIIDHESERAIEASNVKKDDIQNHSTLYALWAHEQESTKTPEDFDNFIFKCTDELEAQLVIFIQKNIKPLKEYITTMNLVNFPGEIKLKDIS